MNLGQLIKQKRKEKNLTMEELGRAIGKNKVFISRLENNSVKTLKHDIIVPLSKILDIDIISFFKDFDENGNTEQLSPKQFMSEVLPLIDKITNITDKEKEMLKDNIRFICDEEE